MIPNKALNKKTLLNFYHSVQEIKKNTVKKIFLLSGPIGVGKTQFVKFFLNNLDDLSLNLQNSSLNLQNESIIKVTSPTFLGYIIYENKEEKYYHFDLYKKKDIKDDLLTAYLNNATIFIEWSDFLDEFFLNLFKNQALLINLTPKDMKIIEI